MLKTFQQLTPPHQITWLFIVSIVGWMQMHSIPHWQTISGDGGGTYVSIVIEAVAIWAWYFRKSLLGFFLSLALLSGPLYDIAYSEFETMRKDKSQSEHITIDKAHLENVGKSTVDLAKHGYAGYYKKAVADANATMSKLHQAIDKEAKQLDDWQHWANIGQSAYVLIFLWITQISMLVFVRPAPAKKSWFSNRFSKDSKPLESVSSDRPKVSSELESTGKGDEQTGKDLETFPTPAEVFGKLTVFKMKRNVPWLTIGEELNVPSKEFSRLQNRAGNIEGKDYISDNKLKDIYEALKAKGAW